MPASLVHRHTLPLTLAHPRPTRSHSHTHNPPPHTHCRHQRFRALFRAGAPYAELLSPADRALLPRLARFQAAVAYRRAPPASLEGALEGAELRAHYDALLQQYGLGGRLRW